eukprot:scaffold75014_cov65-Phaeocystis_antarctica.AAC.1
MPSRRRRGRRPSSTPCSAPITELVVTGDCAVGATGQVPKRGWLVQSAGSGWDAPARKEQEDQQRHGGSCATNECRG